MVAAEQLEDLARTTRALLVAVCGRRERRHEPLLAGLIGMAAGAAIFAAGVVVGLQ